MLVFEIMGCWIVLYLFILFIGLVGLMNYIGLFNVFIYCFEKRKYFCENKKIEKLRKDS